MTGLWKFLLQLHLTGTVSHEKEGPGPSGGVRSHRLSENVCEPLAPEMINHQNPAGRTAVLVSLGMNAAVSNFISYVQFPQLLSQGPTERSISGSFLLTEYKTLSVWLSQL